MIAAFAGVLALLEQANGIQVRIGQHAGNVFHRLGRDLRSMAARDQVFGRELPGQFGHAAVHFGHSGSPRLWSFKAWILQKVRSLQQRKDPVPGIIGIGHHHNVAIGGGEGLAIGIKLAAVARRANRRVKCQSAQVLAQHETGEGFVHWHFHFLPFAGPFAVEQRGDGGIGGVEAGNLISDQ